jgi:RNA polymerase sigma-70 factor (ECF subfamily)
MNEIRRMVDAAVGPAPAIFATTHWSVVVAAGDGSSPESQGALASLCQTYWRPLYAYVRRRGYDLHDAQDLVQAFFEQAIEKNYVGAADRERGRFRTFLLASLEHFLAKQWRRGQRVKRGGGHQIVSLEELTAEESRRLEPAHELSAERLYDRRWALTVLERAMERLRREYDEPARRRVFDELAVLLSGDRPGLTYVELGGRLGLSEASVKVAVHRLRQRYGECVRAEVAETVSQPAQIEEELQQLFAALAG